MGLHRLPEANLKALPQITGYPQPAQAAVTSRSPFVFREQAAHTQSTG